MYVVLEYRYVWPGYSLSYEVCSTVDEPIEGAEKGKGKGKGGEEWTVA